MPPTLSFLLMIAMLDLAAPAAAAAQRFLTTFGAASELKAARGTIGAVAGDFNGDGRSDIAAFGEGEVRFFIADSTPPHPVRWSAGAPLLLRQGRIAACAAARLNGDRLSDLVVLTRDPDRILVYLSRPEGPWFPSWQAELPAPAEEILLADLSGDGRPDILLFGKKSLGVAVYPGTGKGTFGRAVTILPDYSFGALLAADLHGRGIPDLVGANWITNELVLFAGFGRLKFGEPATIPCAAEPAWLAPLGADSLPAFAAGFAGTSPSIVVYRGDGLGAFRAEETIPIGLDPAGLAAADANGDGRDDLVVPANGRGGAAVVVLLNDGRGGFGETVTFAAGARADAYALLREGTGDGARVGAAVLDTSAGRMRILEASREDGPAAEETTLGAGLGPAPVIAAPFGAGSGIVVGNAGSPSLSIFLDDRGGAYTGQISCSLPGAPRSLAALRRNDSLSTAVAASPGSLYVVDIALPGFSHAVTTLPTEGTARILRIGCDPSGAFLRITAFEPDVPKPSLVEYEQISSTRFVERTLPIQSASQLRALTLGDFTGDGRDDLVYAAASRQHHTAELLLAAGNLSGSFGAPRAFGSIPGGDTLDVRLWHGELNGDGRDDLVVGTGPPASTLTIYLADSLPRPAAVPLPGADADGDDRLRIADADGDGLNDIILYNAATRSIELYTGRGDGGFNPPVRLAAAEGPGGFDIGRGAAGERNLVMTDSLNGFLRVIALGSRGR